MTEARTEAYQYLLESLRHFIAQEQGKALKFNYPPETAEARYKVFKAIEAELRAKIQPYPRWSGHLIPKQPWAWDSSPLRP